MDLTLNMSIEFLIVGIVGFILSILAFKFVIKLSRT